jgi:serralysin
MADITGTNGDDILTGTGDPEVICGFAGNDRLFGGGGSDFLDGGPGADLLDGGDAGPSGNIATYLSARTGVHATLRNPSENTGDAAGDTYINIQRLEGSNFDDILHGNSRDNGLSGRSGDDILDGGGGGDRLFGGLGLDSASYMFALTGIVASLANPSENTGEADGDAYDSIENLLGSNFNDRLTGDDRHNFLAGNGGDDQLVGGAGNDTLDGGVGSNILAGGVGVDTVDYSTASAAVFVLLEQAFGFGGGRSDLYTDIENVIGSAFDDELLGDSVDNDIRGGLGNDKLDGGLGADLLDGGAGSDQIDGGLGNDKLDGGLGNDKLEGGFGADLLDGGAGADAMFGGAGDDVYIVDAAGDVTTENAEEGTDTVRSHIDWTLGAEIERLELHFLGNLSGTGNTLANTLVGNERVNTLNGLGGADLMQGLRGNDRYFVDNVADTVVETEGEGTADRVLTSVSYALGAAAQVEILSTTNAAGVGAINLTGNNFVQTIIGNAGANTLNGLGGADLMQGLGGNDRYVVDNAADVVVEAVGGGTDRVLTSVNYSLDPGVEVEILSTNNANATTALKLAGNAFANAIVGNSGNNFINGASGSDTLTGWVGDDIFMFNTALGASNVDTITDFTVVDDTIRLDNAIFTSIAGTGVLTAAQFTANASGTAQDASDRIIYETDTGKLIYDSNGSAAGGAVQFALLDAGLALTNADFFIV